MFRYTEHVQSIARTVVCNLPQIHKQSGCNKKSVYTTEAICDWITQADATGVYGDKNSVSTRTKPIFELNMQYAPVRFHVRISNAIALTRF